MELLKKLVKLKGLWALIFLVAMIAFLFAPTPSFMKPTWQQYAGCAAARVVSFDTEGVVFFLDLAVERANERGLNFTRADVIPVMDKAVEKIMSSGEVKDIREAQRAYFSPCAP
ncbi:hypothetical protein [Billgrantia montanilacus]|uniref:hypothetical protein n=1 Tax=Billgrantia montanilacus TaxID=2282305 RepID=UPI0011C04CD4|nr:hypothetical protein [Halomonas montanilacus]